MMSLSEYRRKKALHMNATIDKRLSRKLELNLGWSDQTEVFIVLDYFDLVGGVSCLVIGGMSLF